MKEDERISRAAALALNGLTIDDDTNSWYETPRSKGLTILKLEKLFKKYGKGITPDGLNKLYAATRIAKQANRDKDTIKDAIKGLLHASETVRTEDIQKACLILAPQKNSKPHNTTNFELPQPIETTYNGYRFRSRLEARWAVFFTTLGIDWDYESEGFDLGPPFGKPTNYYLPDFCLYDVPFRNSHRDVWVEVKAHELTDDEADKCSMMGAAVGLCLALVGSRPSDKRYTIWETEGATDFSFSDDYDPNLVERAVTAARSARFEHDDRARMAAVFN